MTVLSNIPTNLYMALYCILLRCFIVASLLYCFVNRLLGGYNTIQCHVKFWGSIRQLSEMKDSAELAKINSHPTSGSEIFVLLKTSPICEKLKSNPVKVKTPPKT